MIDVHTTSCPASSSSLFISAAIGADDTATGVPNKAINAGKHILLFIPKKLPFLFKKYATTRHATGTISTRARVPAIICFLSLEIALKVKSPPKASKARGDATSFKLLIVVYKKAKHIFLIGGVNSSIYAYINDEITSENLISILELYLK